MTFSFKDKFKVIAIMIVVCMIAIVVIGLNAYSAKLQYEINSLNREIQANEKSAANINSLEIRAKNLGLVYPNFDQIVYLKKEGQEPTELALALKETVYQ